MGSSPKVIEAYVAGQARLGYGEFVPGPEPSDVILVSLPKKSRKKSGTKKSGTGYDFSLAFPAVQIDTASCSPFSPGYHLAGRIGSRMCDGRAWL